MERKTSPVIMERYCPVVDGNVVIMKNIVKNDGSYKCISHTDCTDRESCRVYPVKDRDCEKGAS